MGRILTTPTIRFVTYLSVALALGLISCQNSSSDLGMVHKKGDYPGYHPDAESELIRTYIDPSTGEIPSGIRHRELEYIRALPKKTDVNYRGVGFTPPIDWYDAGPSNVGGRTRALAFDLDNPQTLLAGGVTGGVWKSTDGGTSWQLKSEPGTHLNVTTMVQDPRPGFRETWYYGTGEIRGENGWDRGYKARNFGTGIYKSTDNGETWEVLPGSIPGSSTAWDGAFDFVHRIVISPTTGTRFIANNASGIYRTTDDENFPRVLGQLAEHIYNDIAVGSDGRLVATMSSLQINGTHNSTGGVFVSYNDGLDWEEITPPSFPTQHHRSLVAIAPSNPDVAYVLTFTGEWLPNNREDIRLHYLDLASGTSEDRTDFLPDFPGSNPYNGPALNSLGSYCMALAVRPDNENFVVIGGNALYRSSTGFSEPIPANQALTIIGGYQDVDGVGYPHKYPNHWVDQHAVVFHPDNPVEMWNGNDSGIYRTLNSDEEVVEWDDMSNGYNTIQFFFVTMGTGAGDTRIMGGAQDNGTVYFQNVGTNGEPSFTDGLEICSGDGSYGYFGQNYAYTSLQKGVTRRANYLNAEQTEIQTHLTFSLVSVAPPIAANTDNLFYIHPFVIDPNDEQVMYYPEANVLWRNQNIEANNPLNFWSKLNNVAAPGGYTISTLSVSKEPAHILYFGASHFNQAPRIYRFNNSNSGTIGLQDISIPSAANGSYVHSMAINPENAEELIVVLSNYNILGLFHSIDGGSTWTTIEGNLAGNSNFPGPSLRSASILPLTYAGLDETLYLIGTSAGLFSTSSIDGNATIWTQEAFGEMGNAIAEMITTRPTDGRIAIGTFGRGIFLGEIDTGSVATEEPYKKPNDITFTVWPNPASDFLYFGMSKKEPTTGTVRIFDINGRVLLNQESGGAISVSQLQRGTYILHFQNEESSFTKLWVKD